MLGKGITNIIQAFTPLGDTADYWLAAVFGILALLLTWWVVVKGPVYIKWFNWVVAPGLVIVMVILLVFIFQNYGWSEIVAAKPTGPSGDNLWDYTIAIEWSLGFAFSWWWIMGAMSRITKTQRAVAVGFVVGEAFPAGIAIIIGMFTALVVGTFDPTEWLIPVAGRGWGVVGLVFMVLANITSGALMAYAGGMAVRTYKVGRKWSWRLTTFFVLLPAIITMLFQDFIYTRLGQVLAIWAILLAPLTAIVFVDYFLLRKQHLDLKAVYDGSPGSKYYFWKGVNPAFVVSVVVSFGFYYWMLDPISLRSSGLFKYTGAAIPTFILAGIVYYALTKWLVVPRGWGDYPKLPHARAARKQEIERLEQTI
jgi:NCS1 family nucleobase:cation symporter-1